MKTLRAAIAGILALFVATTAIAQTFPTVPSQSVIGRLGVPGQSGPSQAIPFTTLKAQLGISTPSIAKLRALAPGITDSVAVLGYYANGDGGGGTFVWSGSSAATDNGGSIIAPSAGGTGRWIRQTAVSNQYTPEMFGAKHDGTDDGAFFDSLMFYLSGMSNGGTVHLSCGTVYTISSLSPNGRSIVRLFSNVNIVGCGDTSVIKMGNNVNTSSALFANGLYRTGTLNNVRYENFTIDMNGQNNSCAGACYNSNAALGAYAGNDITVRGIRFINNPGTNNTVFATNSDPAAITNLTLIDNVHEHNGDIVNPASLDFSADFVIASNSTIKNIRYSDGPRVNGSAFEIHGQGVVAEGLVVTDHFNCGIIANEPTGTATITKDIILGAFKCTNVKAGIQVYSKTVSTNTNVNIHDGVISMLSGFSGMGIDACSVVDAASGNNINLSVDNVSVYSDVTTNLGSDLSGICVGRWKSAKINNNQTYNTQGPGIRFIASVNGAALTATGNQIVNPGRTSNTALQAGIVADATSGITTDNINIQNNPITGTVRYAVIGAQNSTGGYIIGNLATGATVGQSNWTGTGAVVISIPGASLTMAGSNIAQTWSALQRFNDNMFALNGSTSGTVTLRAPATAGSSIIRFPAGSTDFSATGGTSQVVKQVSAGAAFTVGQLVAGDISGLAAIATSGSAADLGTGTILAGRMPAHTGGCTNSAGSLALSCVINTPILFSAGSLATLTAAGTYFLGTGTAAGAENVVAIPMSVAGTLKNMRVSTNTGPGGVTTYIASVSKNGSIVGGPTVTLTGASTTGSDLSTTLAVAAGDLISIKLVTLAGAATANGFNVGLTLVTTSP